MIEIKVSFDEDEVLRMFSANGFRIDSELLEFEHQNSVVIGKSFFVVNPFDGNKILLEDAFRQYVKSLKTFPLPDGYFRLDLLNLFKNFEY
jgi:hypothetical protein